MLPSTTEATCRLRPISVTVPGFFLNEKDEARAATRRPLIFDNTFNSSSASPSEKYSRSLSPPMFVNGITATEFLQVSGQKPTAYQRMMMMTSAQVAGIGIRAMLKGRYSVVPGFLNWLTALFTFVTPDPLNAAAAYRLMKN